MGKFKAYRKKLKGIAKSESEGRHNNLKCVVDKDAFDDDQDPALMVPLKQLLSEHRFAKAAEIVDDAWTKEIHSETGRKFYSDAGHELTELFFPEREGVAQNIELLQYYSKWYEDAPNCPYAAASYARGLQMTGHSMRGIKTIGSVSDAAYERMVSKNDQASDVFAATRDKFHNHWYWAICFLHSFLTGAGSTDEMWDAFMQCVEVNPHDVRNYEIMAYLMLPRWHGSFEMIDGVAAAAADVTQVEYGQMMYTRTYASVFEYEMTKHLKYDWLRLKQGYRDWLMHFPSDYIATQFVSMLYSNGDYREALQVLERLETFYVKACHSYAVERQDDYKILNSVCLEFHRP